MSSNTIKCFYIYNAILYLLDTVYIYKIYIHLELCIYILVYYHVLYFIMFLSTLLVVLITLSWSICSTMILLFREIAVLQLETTLKIYYFYGRIIFFIYKN